MSISPEELGAALAATVIAIAEACAPERIEPAIEQAAQSLRQTGPCLPPAAARAIAVLVAALDDSRPRRSLN